jgi:hypothetical protein
MIVYRAQGHIENSSQLLRRFQRMLRRYAQNRSRKHEHTVELLIEFGELEAAVADALCPDKDSSNPIARSLRHASLTLGRLFWHSWKGAGSEIGRWLDKLDLAIHEISSLSLPETVQLNVSEGYAYYGLYPETYLESAIRFFRKQRPGLAVCVGIRSIGTSLSAIVSAALEEQGCIVHSLTVRPRGHPFDRRLILSSQLEDDLRSLAEAHFLIVDEGPGMSGSSLACVAQRLFEFGVAENRILFFPSWEPNGANFLAKVARERWPRHRKYTTGFEDVWVESNRLTQGLSAAELLDISAGNWRPLFYRSESDYPVVQPHHERRKYLSRERTSPAALQAEIFQSAVLDGENRTTKPAALLLKFAGLGHYGQSTLARAERLAEAGFGPSVIGVHNGFLLSQFIYGLPVSAKNVDQELLDTVARYLVHLKESFPSARPLPYDVDLEMIRANVAEALGKKWEDKVVRLEKLKSIICDNPATAIDGRMLPHEWVLTAEGYVKVDGTDHHADHFFPGCQDVAWDIAASCVEFELERRRQDYLIEKYQSLVNDKSLQKRLPFYFIAYLSYRLGYAVLAARVLHGSVDGDKFKSLACRYSRLARREICRLQQT